MYIQYIDDHVARLRATDRYRLAGRFQRWRTVSWPVAQRRADNGPMPAFLETDRLVLRGFTEADAGNLYELNRDRDVMWFLTGGEPTPREEVRDRIIPFFLSFYERSRGSGSGPPKPGRLAISWAGSTSGPPKTAALTWGYRLRKAAWNQGYATEGSRALIRTCFTDLDVRRVVAHTMAVNQPSRRVMEKCGLALVRSYHSDDVPDILGADQGEVQYALTREQWQTAACPGYVRTLARRDSVGGISGKRLRDAPDGSAMPAGWTARDRGVLSPGKSASGPAKTYLSRQNRTFL